MTVTYYFLQFNSVLIIGLIDLVLGLEGLILVLVLECLVLVLGGQVLVNITEVRTDGRTSDPCY